MLLTAQAGQAACLDQIHRPKDACQSQPGAEASWPRSWSLDMKLSQKASEGWGGSHGSFGRRWNRAGAQGQPCTGEGFPQRPQVSSHPERLPVVSKFPLTPPSFRRHLPKATCFF